MDDTKSYPSGKKENHLCSVKGVELKEDNDEFHVYGYIATSHEDAQGDIAPYDTLTAWQNSINNPTEHCYHGVNHSEEKGVFYGEAEKTAEVHQLNDGYYGLWVDSKYLKSNPETADIIKGWQEGKYNSFSITYGTDGCQTCDFIIDNDKLTRIIGPESHLFGYTGTDIPANKNAVATDFQFKELKELFPKKKEESKNLKKEDKEDKMSEENKTNSEQPKEAAQSEKKEESEVDVKAIAKELKQSILKSIMAELKEQKPDNTPMLNKGDKIEKKEVKVEKKEVEFKNIIERFKEKVLDNKASTKSQWETCKELKSFIKANNLPIRDIEENEIAPFEIKERYPKSELFPIISMQDNPLEMKGIPTHLTTDDNYSGAQTSYVSALANYEQSPARYNDIYGPYIINQLNDETTAWNLLAKDNMSGMSSIAFRVRRGRNATAGTYAYGSEPGWDSNVSLLKCNLHFITSYVEVAAEWEAMELAKGGGGIDVYQTELQYGALDLMNYINGQIFGTGDGTSETAALGFETLCKTYSGGATTLYGRNRSTYTTLDSAGYEDLSAAPFTLDKARAMIESVRVNGARREDLVFILSLRQERLFYQLIQDMQRTVPTSARIGFTGNIEVDGVPIFADKRLDDDSKTDDIYVIDTRHTRIALKKAPTYVEMAQISLHRRGIIWMMWNLYSTAPNHNYWCYNAATS